MRINYNNKLKTLGPQSAHLITTLYERNRPIFQLKDAAEILNFSKATARDFVSKLVRRGIATRLKPGLFIIVPFELGKERDYIGNPFIVAREIVGGKNYYLSHGTAMEIHGMVTQPQLIVYVTSLKKRRPVKALGIEFRFIQSQQELLFGLSDQWITKQEKVRVSNLERTIIDCLKKPQYCGGLTQVAKGLWMRHQDMNITRLIEYAMKIHVGSVASRLGYLLELYRIGNPEHLEILRHILKESYVCLDPILPREGQYLRRWRLQLNVSAEELRSAVST